MINSSLMISEYKKTNNALRDLLWH